MFDAKTPSLWYFVRWCEKTNTVSCKTKSRYPLEVILQPSAPGRMSSSQLFWLFLMHWSHEHKCEMLPPFGEEAGVKGREFLLWDFKKKRPLELQTQGGCWFAGCPAAWSEDMTSHWGSGTWLILYRTFGTAMTQRRFSEMVSVGFLTPPGVSLVPWGMPWCLLHLVAVRSHEFYLSLGYRHRPSR